MAVNKVELGNETLIDLTSDTVQADTLLNGATAHAANGEQIVGKVNGVKYFENPQDYYNLSIEEREAINELVILNEDGEPLDASLITYGASNVGAELQRLDNEITDLNDFKNNVSDAWNSSTNYTVGQYCIYNNILWKCLVQNIGQTPSEGTYWTKVTIGSEFNLVKNDIDTLNSNLANHINGFSNVNVNGTISYMQIGKLVIVRLVGHPISDTSTLDVPISSSNLVVSLRDEINGNLAKFWFNRERIEVFKAENYTSGHRYSGQFCYIAQ